MPLAGCYSGDDRAIFHLLPRPTHDDLDALAFNVEMRVLAWLRRRNLLGDGDDTSGAEPARSAIDACLEGSMGTGELAALENTGEPATEAALPRATKSERRAGRSRGFDIHAGVFVSANRVRRKDAVESHERVPWRRDQGRQSSAAAPPP